MQSSKVESLIATYAGMDSSEIERRLSSGQLTPVAMRIARAELDYRGAEKSPDVAAAVASSDDVANVVAAAEVADVRPTKKMNRVVFFGLAVVALFWVMQIVLTTMWTYGAMFVVLIIGLSIAGGNGMAKMMIKEYGEPDNFATRVWGTFLLIPSVIGGYFAVRVLTGLSISGIGQFVLMIPAFAGGGAIGFGVPFILGRVLGGLGRLIVAMFTLGILYFVLVVPMNSRSEAEMKERVARFENQLEAGRRLMESIPHAPAGVVPDMLDVRKDVAGLSITNIGDKNLWVKVALVVPSGRIFNRCSAWADDQPKSCNTHIGKDGTETIDSCHNSRTPALPPGQTAMFKFARCSPSFETGMLEFKVFDEISSVQMVNKEFAAVGKDHLVFQSDSAFVPGGW